MTTRNPTQKKGLALRLHDLEAEIMDVVWAQGWEWFPVSDVLAVLQKRREIAYTTVATTVIRLFDKGVLKHRRDGRRWLYAARSTREEFLHSTARQVLAGLGRGKSEGAIALLADTVKKADEGVLDELERLIQARRKELGA